MASQEYDLINNLGGASKTDSLAHCAVCCENGRKIITLTTKKETPITFINYWRKGAPAIVTKPVNAIDSTSKAKNINFLFSRETILSGYKQ